MKANEFVKKYGWDRAKEILDSVKIKISFDGRVCNPCFITEDGDYVYDKFENLILFLEAEVNGTDECDEVLEAKKALNALYQIIEIVVVV